MTGEIDTVELTYDNRGNEISKTLISRLRENFAAPVIIREKYDSLDRVTETIGYGFSLSNEDIESLTMADTSHAIMDTLSVTYSYSDTLKVERMEYISHLLGQTFTDIETSFTSYDSSGREIYMKKVYPDGIKGQEKTTAYNDDHIVTSKVYRHQSGEEYLNHLDTLFLDTLGRSFKKRAYDDDDNLKYKTWSKCGNCEHLYFRNDSGKIIKELWQDFNGQLWKESEWQYENDSIGNIRKIIKNSVLHVANTEHYSSKTEQWKYDRFENLTYYELKRKRRTIWVKYIYEYKPKKNPKGNSRPPKDIKPPE